MRLRNVLEFLQKLPVEDILFWRRRRTLPASLMLLNLQYGGNIGAAVRTAEAFGFREVIYVGRKHYNRHAAVGMYNYIPVRHFPTLEEATIALGSHYHWVALEQHPRAQPLPEYRPPWWPILLVAGNEKEGLYDHPEALAQCSDVVYIPQLGVGRSLNVSHAVAIACYHFSNIVASGERRFPPRRRMV